MYAKNNRYIQFVEDLGVDLEIGAMYKPTQL